MTILSYATNTSHNDASLAILAQLDLCDWESEYLLSAIEFHEVELERHIQQHRDLTRWRRDLMAALSAALAIEAVPA